MIVTFGLELDKVHTIHFYGCDDIGDDPSSHRWRATWGQDGSGIWLQAYPVIRPTPTGVWIAKYAYRRSGVWDYEEVYKRWISNKSRASYAKPTKDDAIKSLAIRLTRWTCRIKAEYDRAMSAAETLAAIRPELASYADTAKKNLTALL